MTKKIEALKAVYAALGGTAADVADVQSEIGVLNAILALGEVDGAQFIPDAIAAIAENAESILPGTSPTLQDKTVTPTTSQQTITADEGKDGLFIPKIPNNRTPHRAGCFYIVRNDAKLSSNAERYRDNKLKARKNYHEKRRRNEVVSRSH